MEVAVFSTAGSWSIEGPIETLLPAAEHSALVAADCWSAVNSCACDTTGTASSMTSAITIPDCFARELLISRSSLRRYGPPFNHRQQSRTPLGPYSPRGTLRKARRRLEKQEVWAIERSTASH